MRSRLTRACWLAAILILLGCGAYAVAATGGTSSARPRHGTPADGPGTPARVAAVHARGDYSPAPAVNQFGLDLMRRLPGGNLAFSPDSLASALAMAGTGAAGATAGQMAHVLSLPAVGDFETVGVLQQTIRAEQAATAHGHPEAPTLSLANAIFVQEGFALAAPFLAGLKEHFGVEALRADFQHDPAGAAGAINGWVSEHTHGLIAQIVGELPAQTRLALANAIYLKAAWLHPFSASATAPGLFDGPAKRARVPFMHQTEVLPYRRGRGYAALELPYAASTLSLLVLLPVGESAGTLERGLTAQRLAAIVRDMSPHGVRLSLPRFQLAFRAIVNGPLEALGMPDAFGQGANFSHITTSEDLQIGEVAHAADFTVDEVGTLAAAASAVTIEATAALKPPPHPVSFDADRPFLFFLRDDHTGAVLFAGRLTEASSAQVSP